jgi:hypothetical protein
VAAPPRRVLLRALALLAAVCAAGLAAGCGSDSEGDAGAEKAARQVVERFGAAAAGHDYQTICDDLLSEELIKTVESVGLPCEVALQKGLASVREPKIEVRQVRVQGARALVSVHSTAAGQQPSDDAVQLVREDGEWRIASLVSPGGQSTTTTTTTTPSTTSVPPPDHDDRDAAAERRDRRKPE